MWCITHLTWSFLLLILNFMSLPIMCRWEDDDNDSVLYQHCNDDVIINIVTISRWKHVFNHLLLIYLFIYIVFFNLCSYSYLFISFSSYLITFFLFFLDGILFPCASVLFAWDLLAALGADLCGRLEGTGDCCRLTARARDRNTATINNSYSKVNQYFLICCDGIKISQLEK